MKRKSIIRVYPNFDRIISGSSWLQLVYVLAIVAIVYILFVGLLELLGSTLTSGGDSVSSFQGVLYHLLDPGSIADENGRDIIT